MFDTVFIKQIINDFTWWFISFIINILIRFIKKHNKSINNKFDTDTLRLKNSKSYEEWKEFISIIYDTNEFKSLKKQTNINNFDYHLINERFKLLKETRLNYDFEKLMSLLRSGLIRNYGGISQKSLMIMSFLEKNYIIQKYIEEVSKCLDFISHSINTSYKIDKNDVFMNSKQLKLNFLHDVRQTFGSTALILQGGSLFGFCHLGVVKALYIKKLLPSVICGSSIGASVASLICLIEDENLFLVLKSPFDAMRKVFDVDFHNKLLKSSIKNVFKKKCSNEVLLFLEFTKHIVGNLTLEDAYKKTKKVLNIIVHQQNQCSPVLLNYITAPNVVIWSAIHASIGNSDIYDDYNLYIKNFDEQIVPKKNYENLNFSGLNKHKKYKKCFDFKRSLNFDTKEDTLNDLYLNMRAQKDSPYNRLAELFNVNHFITSTARPYTLPLLLEQKKNIICYSQFYKKKTYFNINKNENNQSKIKKILIFMNNLIEKLKTIFYLEIQHRLIVLNKFGFLTNSMMELFLQEKSYDKKSNNSNDEVRLFPEFDNYIIDFCKIFDTKNISDNISYWVSIGEKSVWPLVSLLSTRCSIEFKLNDLFQSHKKKFNVLCAN